MQLCPKCRAVIPVGKRVCERCGNSIGGSSASAGVNSAPAARTAGPAPQQGRRNAAEMLKGSRHYYQYKALFDRLYMYGTKYEPFVFEILLWSLDNGHQINETYVLSSATNGLPYLCESEMEFEKIVSIFDAYKQGKRINNILDLSAFYGPYAQPATRHPHKMTYWGVVLTNMIKQGDPEATAAVLSVGKDRGKKEFFGEGVLDSIYDGLEAKMRNAAASGDLTALLYVARYMTMTPRNLEEYNKWLGMFLEAAKANTSDAWYWLAYAAYLKIHIASWAPNNPMYKDCDITVSPEEKEEIQRKYCEYYLKGAQANNGKTAPEMQKMVAEWYGYGDMEKYGIPADYNKAVYWYRALESRGLNVSMELETLNSVWRNRR